MHYQGARVFPDPLVECMAAWVVCLLFTASVVNFILPEMNKNKYTRQW